MWFNSASDKTSDTYFSSAILCVVLVTHLQEINSQTEEWCCEKQNWKPYLSRGGWREFVLHSSAKKETEREHDSSLKIFVRQQVGRKGIVFKLKERTWEVQSKLILHSPNLKRKPPNLSCLTKTKFILELVRREWRRTGLSSGQWVEL